MTGKPQIEAFVDAAIHVRERELEVVERGRERQREPLARSQ
jgi:hypothetical protein